RLPRRRGALLPPPLRPGLLLVRPRPPGRRPAPGPRRPTRRRLALPRLRAALPGTRPRPAAGGRQHVLGAADRPAPGPGRHLPLCTLPVVLGFVRHFRATSVLVADWRYQLGWNYVGAMLVTALSCRVGAHLYRQTRPGLSVTYFFGTAAALLLGAAGLLLVVN